jgi:hypothetical protein
MSQFIGRTRLNPCHHLGHARFDYLDYFMWRDKRELFEATTSKIVDAVSPRSVVVTDGPIAFVIGRERTNVKARRAR